MSDLATAALRGARRGVIVTASDAGLCYGVNEAVRLCLAEGLVSSASLIVVAPFARDAARRIGANLGVQVALSSEHELIDLRPVTHAPSLLGGRGGFPTDAEDAAEHADPDEAYREFRAQVERAIVLGVTPAFLASHDDVVARQLALFDVFLDLAEEYHLAIRHGYDFSATSLDAARLARERGHFVAASTVNWSADIGDLNDVVAALPDGVSELIVSPGVIGDEIEAMLSDAAQRDATLRALRRTPPRDVATRHDVAWLSWSDLRGA